MDTSVFKKLSHTQYKTKKIYLEILHIDLLWLKVIEKINFVFYLIVVAVYVPLLQLVKLSSRLKNKQRHRNLLYLYRNVCYVLLIFFYSSIIKIQKTCLKEISKKKNKILDIMKQNTVKINNILVHMIMMLHFYTCI